MERTTTRNRFAIAATLAAILTVGAVGGAGAAGASGYGVSGAVQQQPDRATVGGALSGRPTCPAPVAHEAFGPKAIQHSWGVIVESNDGPQVQYTWSELARLGCIRAPE